MSSVADALRSPRKSYLTLAARNVVMLGCVLALQLPAVAQQSGAGINDTPAPTVTVALPDAPSASEAVEGHSIGSDLGRGALTIGRDELTFIKGPFHTKNLKWDALFVAAMAPLIATDEHVAQQVNPAWHDTSITISNAMVGVDAATAGTIFVAGLITDNTHAKDTGVASARAAADSFLLLAAMKPIFARERPYSGGAEGKFFSGNFTGGSFPSGHSMFTWTIASVIAHEYPKWPVALAMYSVATAASTTRVTGGVHFPSDVVAGAAFGYLIGRYVARQDNHLPGDEPLHTKSRMTRVEDAILSRVSFGVQ